MLKKKSSLEESEDDFVKRVKKKMAKRQQHGIIELAQEKMLLDEMNKYLEKNETVSQEVFDAFSHELRTPIVTIKSYVDMILQGKFGKVSSDQKLRLIQISKNTDLLIDVIMKMLEKIKERK